MNYFLRANRNLISYALIFLLFVPIFGINFFLSLLGNIILLLILIPILLFLLVFLGFNSYKSKIKICNVCGGVSLGLSQTCMNCGAKFEHSTTGNDLDKKPSESTIEIKAEEIK